MGKIEELNIYESKSHRIYKNSLSSLKSNSHKKSNIYSTHFF